MHYKSLKSKSPCLMMIYFKISQYTWYKELILSRYKHYKGLKTMHKKRQKYIKIVNYEGGLKIHYLHVKRPILNRMIYFKRILYTRFKELFLPQHMHYKSLKTKPKNTSKIRGKSYIMRVDQICNISMLKDTILHWMIYFKSLLYTWYKELIFSWYKHYKSLQSKYNKIMRVDLKFKISLIKDTIIYLMIFFP